MKNSSQSKIIEMKDLRMKAHKNLYLHLARYKHIRNQLKRPLMVYRKK